MLKRNTLKKIAIGALWVGAAGIFSACSPKGPKFQGVDLTGAEYGRDLPLLLRALAQPLRTALLAALPGTLAEGATIEMHTIPAQARCLQCATVYEPPDRIEPCPHCGSARKQWLSGQTLTLRSVEGESCRA